MAKTIAKNVKPDTIFTLHRGTLTVDADLYWEYLEDFEKACDKLLQTNRDRLIVDLTSINFISSSYVGCLGNLLIKAAKAKKKVVLRVTVDVSWLFDIMEGQKIMDMEVV